MDDYECSSFNEVLVNYYVFRFCGELRLLLMCWIVVMFIIDFVFEFLEFLVCEDVDVLIYEVFVDVVYLGDWNFVGLSW